MLYDQQQKKSSLYTTLELIGEKKVSSELFCSYTRSALFLFLSFDASVYTILRETAFTQTCSSKLIQCNRKKLSTLIMLTIRDQ